MRFGIDLPHDGAAVIAWLAAVRGLNIRFGAR
jgi:hypothetical protein